MIQVLAILSVADFDALDEFETLAIGIINDYGGTLVSAFESSDFTEIHLLQFPSEASFEEYQADSRLAKLTDLRLKAISATKLYRSVKLKEYPLAHGRHL